MKFRPRLLAGVVAAAAMVAAPCFALLVQPIVIDMTTSGARSSAALTVVNDRRTPETVEVTVGKLALPERGPAQVTPDKGDEFLIFPPRATIEPGKTQVFRIRWLGEPVIPRSKLYMFSTTELPVSKGEGSGIQLLYSIQSLVTVSSPQLRPDISIPSVQRATGRAPSPADPTRPPPTVPGVDITVDNKGAAVAYVSHARLTLKTGDGKWTKRIEQLDVAKAVGLGVAPPAQKRVFFVPVDGVPAAGDLSATLDLVPTR